MQQKMQLVPVAVQWQAGSYDIHVVASTSGSLSVTTFVALADERITRLQIDFHSYAAYKYCNFNFGEQHYNQYEIQSPSGTFLTDTADWTPFLQLFSDTNICPNPSFYEVINTSWFDEKEAYRKLAGKGFKHYLLIGYDTYIEILAQPQFIMNLEGEG